MNIWDLVFPKRCVGCAGWGKYICDKCEIGMNECEQVCPVCAGGSSQGKCHGRCAGRGDLEGMSAFWDYEGVVKKLIEEVKYEGYFDCMSELGEKMMMAMAGERFESLRSYLECLPVAVPVPLYQKRERKRGFNQAEIIAKPLAVRHKLSLNGHLLMRIRDTGQQVGRSRQERLMAMKGVFSLRNENWKLKMPEAVLLVDDVWTTGATMQECAKVLKKAGVKKVWGIVVAR